jgi:hypothetical protein
MSALSPRELDAKAEDVRGVLRDITKYNLLLMEAVERQKRVETLHKLPAVDTSDTEDSNRYSSLESDDEGSEDEFDRSEADKDAVKGHQELSEDEERYAEAHR